MLLKRIYVKVARHFCRNEKKEEKGEEKGDGRKMGAGRRGRGTR